MKLGAVQVRLSQYIAYACIMLSKTGFAGTWYLLIQDHAGYGFVMMHVDVDVDVVVDVM